MAVVRETLKKVGAATGGFLMIGLSLGAAQSLADFPQPFVDGDGNVASQVVVGSGAAVADVVGAVDIASALGQAAVQTSEQTVSTSGGGFGWSASDGQTLDTRNDNLFFGDNLDSVRDTLTADHLSALEPVTFRDDAGTATGIEFFLTPDNKQIQYGTHGDFGADDDPTLFVDNPAGPTTSDYLYQLSANFEDEVAFNSSDVESQEIELWGRTYTVSSDTTASQLVLFGSSDEVSLETDESTTVTLDGTDHTFEVVAVTSSNTVAFRVDGQLREKSEDEKFTVGTQEVRVADVIQTNSQTSSGLATFSMGSEELTLQDGQPVEDGDNNDVDGTHVTFNGGGGTVDSISSIEVYVGSDDDDRRYVTVGESYRHSLFDQVEFHLAGLNPDASGDADAVSDVTFGTTGDATVTVRFTSDGGDAANVEWAHENTAFDAGIDELADDDGDGFVVVEGANVSENEYFVSDAGGFSHLWEVTDVDLPTSQTNDVQDATVNLRDPVSGQSVEVSLSETGASTNVYHSDNEIIDGKQYYFRVIDDGSDDIEVTWGANAAHADTGDETAIFPALDTDGGAAVAFVDSVQTNAVPPPPANTAFESGEAVSATLSGSDYDVDVNLTNVRNGERTAAEIHGQGDDGAAYVANVSVGAGGTASINTSVSGLTVSFTAPTLTLAYTNTTAVGGQLPTLSSLQLTAAGASGKAPITTTDTGGDLSGSINDVTVANVSRTFNGDIQLPSTESTDDVILTSGDTVTFDAVDNVAATSSPSNFKLGIDITANQEITLKAGNAVANDPSAAVILPEDDNDAEHAYLETPSVDTGSSEVDVSDISYTGAVWHTAALESNTDVTAGYDFFGTYTWYDSDSQGGVTLSIPDGQAVAGAGFTDRGGSLSAGGSGGGTVSYTALSGQGTLGAMGLLDSEVTSSTRQNNHLILVGGPAVNDLVSTLVNNGDVDLSDLQGASSGAHISVVQDAFTSGKHAMVVAGVAADDTRAAARYVQNYGDHAQALADAGQALTLTEADYPAMQ